LLLSTIKIEKAVLCVKIEISSIISNCSDIITWSVQTCLRYTARSKLILGNDERMLVFDPAFSFYIFSSYKIDGNKFI